MRGRPPIGPMHPRLVATFALIPITIGIQIALYVALTWVAWSVAGTSWWLKAGAMILFCLAPVVMFYGGGLLIWWRTVRWTHGKHFGVLVTTLVLLLVLVSTAALVFVSEPLVFVVLPLVGLIGGSIALIVVSRICWEPREGPAVPCPKCGYDLRGQQECRCPECGQQFTVGELMQRDADPMP
jgi:hypothetical protein